MKGAISAVILLASSPVTLAENMKLNFQFDGVRFITVENTSNTTWKKCVANAANAEGTITGYELGIGDIAPKQIVKMDLHEFANKTGERYDISRLKFQGLWVDCRSSRGESVSDGFRWE